MLRTCRRSASPSPRSRRGSGRSSEPRDATTSCSTRPATAGADLVVFPELGLTGYQLQDLAAEVAMRLDDPRLAELAAATEDLSAVVSFVEESADHRLFIAAALLEDGEIRHVHRKLFLPTYGLFDERRFFAAGDLLRAVPSRLGVGHRDRRSARTSGTCPCPSSWRSTARRSSSTCRRRRAATWPRPTRSASGRRPRGGR